MYYYRHGEVIFASLLPDLPLEPAKRPSAGTPSLFLILSAVFSFYML